MPLLSELVETDTVGDAPEAREDTRSERNDHDDGLEVGDAFPIPSIIYVMHNNVNFYRDGVRGRRDVPNFRQLEDCDDWNFVSICAWKDDDADAMDCVVIVNGWSEPL